MSTDNRFGVRKLLPIVAVACILIAVYVTVTSYWSNQQISRLKEQLRHEDPVVRRNAAIEFDHYGRAAVPPLVEALQDNDQQVRERAAESLVTVGLVSSAPLIDLLNDSEARLGRWCADPPIHGARGQQPALFHVFRSRKFRGNREIVAALNAARKDDDEAIRYYAESVLRTDLLKPTEWQREKEELKKGSGGKSLSFWIGHLNHEDANVRLWAAFYIGSKDKAAVPSLIEALTNEDANIRLWAANTLWHIGPEAKEAAPALVEALADQTRSVKCEATVALNLVGRGTDIWQDSQLVEAAVPRLVDVLRNERREARKFAAFTLGQIGPEAKDAVPALMKATHHKDSDIAIPATNALKKIDPDAAAEAGLK